jgi:HEAT repeat protein
VCWAAKMLAERGNDEGFTRLLELVDDVRQRKAPYDMETWIATVRKAGDQRAVPLLLTLFADEGKDIQYCHGNIAGALAAMRDERALQPLLDSVQHMEGEKRADRVATLGAWDHPAIRALLITELNGNDHGSMCAAALALHKLGYSGTGDRLLAVWAQGLEGWQRDERYRLYRTLGEMKEQRAVPGLVAALAADNENAERIARILRDLTGTDLPDDPAAWRTWWDKQQRR